MATIKPATSSASSDEELSFKAMPRALAAVTAEGYSVLPPDQGIGSQAGKGRRSAARPGAFAIAVGRQRMARAGPSSAQVGRQRKPFARRP